MLERYRSEEMKLIHVTEIIPRDTLVPRDNVVFINMLTINSDLDLNILRMQTALCLQCFTLYQYHIKTAPCPDTSRIGLTESSVHGALS